MKTVDNGLWFKYYIYKRYWSISVRYHRYGELVGKLKMAGHHETAAKFKDVLETALKAEAQQGMARR